MWCVSVVNWNIFCWLKVRVMEVWCCVLYCVLILSWCNCVRCCCGYTNNYCSWKLLLLIFSWYIWWLWKGRWRFIWLNNRYWWSVLMMYCCGFVCKVFFRLIWWLLVSCMLLCVIGYDSCWLNICGICFVVWGVLVYIVWCLICS